MPELPEVETIVRDLRAAKGDRPGLPGLRIVRSQILWGRTLAEPGIDDFSERLAGQMIQAINRRGKFIVISLDHDWLLVHLRMSGDLRLVRDDHSEPLLHDRAIIWLDGGWMLAFNDPRKFGRIWLVTDPQLVLGKLGPEPLSEKFTVKDFYHRLSARHTQLKSLLLDQKFLAGLGNIYSDEALHQARLHPLMKSDQVSLEQAENLLNAIKQVLNEGIQNNGASIDWVYRGGGFQNKFRVYQRTGQPCLTCKTPVERIIVGQRSTHFCPVCQPLESENDSCHHLDK